MQLPDQARPIQREVATSRALDRDEYVQFATQQTLAQTCGVSPSGYEQCYRLPGPAQRTCLLMSTH